MCSQAKNIWKPVIETNRSIKPTFFKQSDNSNLRLVTQRRHMADDVQTRYGWCQCNAAFITKAKPSARRAVPDQTFTAADVYLAIAGFGARAYFTIWLAYASRFSCRQYNYTRLMTPASRQKHKWLPSFMGTHSTC